MGEFRARRRARRQRWRLMVDLMCRELSRAGLMEEVFSLKEAARRGRGEEDFYEALREAYEKLPRDRRRFVRNVFKMCFDIDLNVLGEKGGG